MKIEKLRCDNIKRDGDIDKLEEEVTKLILNKLIYIFLFYQVNELHRALIRLKDA